MPNSYIELPIETEPDALAQIGFDYIQSRWPEWEPHDGQLDTWMVTAISRMAAELREVASDVPVSIFQFFGEKLVNLPALEAVAATALTTWTAKDNAGYTVPAGATVGIQDAAGDIQGFELLDDLVIAAGSTSATNVNVTATEDGAQATGLGAPAAIMSLITVPAFITGVTMVAGSSGGQDAEDPDVYLSRLAVELALQAPRPILPDDFATFARNTAGVWRALAIDGYDAVALTFSNARTVTVAVMGEDGNPVSSTIKSGLDADLQAQREVNFVVYVVDPNYTLVDVHFAVVAWPGWDTTDVNARIVASLQNALDPKTWGNPPYGDFPRWYQTTTVKVNDLIGIVGKVEGVKTITSLTQRVSPAAFAATDITLTGAAPVTRPGTDISGTVT
jgi:hypothetical protein